MPEITRRAFPGGELTLKFFGKELQARVSGNGRKAMVKSTLLVERHIKLLMAESPRGGREYLIGKGRRRRTHKASAPGEPPAVRRGFLSPRIRSASSQNADGSVEGVVYTNVLYARFLELGTRVMGSRPAWVRALREKSQEIIEFFRKEGI